MNLIEPVQWQGETLYLMVRVTPGARRNQLGELTELGLVVRLQAPPVEGKANAALIVFLAQAFGVKRSAVTLLSGETSRQKRVRIEAPVNRTPWTNQS